MRLYFRMPNAEGGTWHRGGWEGGEQQAKPRSSGVWEAYIPEFRLTLSQDEIFHSQCFLSNSPGAIEYSIHRPVTLQLEQGGSNCMNQREESSPPLPFSRLGPHSIVHLFQVFPTSPSFRIPAPVLFVPLFPDPTRTLHQQLLARTSNLFSDNWSHAQLSKPFWFDCSIQTKSCCLLQFLRLPILLCCVRIGDWESGKELVQNLLQGKLYFQLANFSVRNIIIETQPTLAEQNNIGFIQHKVQRQASQGYCHIFIQDSKTLWVAPVFLTVCHLIPILRHTLQLPNILQSRSSSFQ